MKIVCNELKDNKIKLGDIIEAEYKDSMYYFMIVTHAGQYNILRLNDYTVVFFDSYQTINRMIEAFEVRYSDYKIILNENAELRLTK